MATMSIVLIIPRLLFGFVAGVYVDRLDRKKLMVLSDILRGCFVLGFILVDSPDKIWILYLIGFLQGSVATFFEPARMALLPNLIPSQGLLAANSITQTSQTIFFMLGNAAAGVLVGTLSTARPVFIIDAITFFVSAMLVSRIAFEHQAPEKLSSLNGHSFFKQLWDGVKLSFGNRILAGTIAAISLTMLGIGAANVLMVPLLINDIGIPETWMGATGAGQTVGMIISGLLIAGLSSRIKPTRLAGFGLVGFGLTMSMISTASSIWHVILIQFISALFIPAITSSTQTILQVAVPDKLRGRTGAARMVLIMIANLISMGAAGILADTIGARNVFIISGSFAVLGGIAAFIIFHGVTLKPIEVKAENEPSPVSSLKQEK
jgi:MFS family permease